MKTNNYLLFIFTFLFSLTGFSILYADQIVFLNGDSLTGQIVEISGESLTFNADMLGTITTKRTDIKEVYREEPIEMSLSDGKTIQGKIDIKDNKITINEKGKKEIISWEKIEKIVPAPEKTIMEEQKDRRKWSGSGKVLASFQKGTVDTTTFESGISITGEKAKDRIEAEISGAYGEVESEINTRRYSGSLRYQYYPGEKWYIYTDTGAERDEGRKLGLRGQIGGGAGYEILSQPEQSWSIEGALMLTHEEWLPYAPFEEGKVKQQQIQDGLNQINNASLRLIQNPSDIVSIGGIIGGTAKVLNPLGNAEKTTNDFTSVKLGSKYYRKIFNSDLSHNLTFEPSLENLDYYRINSITNISTPVSKNTSVELTLSNEYDSEHQKRDIEAWEHRLSAGIKYDFGKK